jgi:tRNA 2-thiouridine synthesizing protein E
VKGVTANKTIENPPERDEEGFLVNAEDWTPELAETFANEQGVKLEGPRRDIVLFVRDYFERNLTVPEARTVLKYMKDKWGKDHATRKYLYQLFPRGYGQQACKIAGMRKPRKLMLDV